MEGCEPQFEMKPRAVMSLAPLFNEVREAIPQRICAVPETGRKIVWLGSVGSSRGGRY